MCLETEQTSLINWRLYHLLELEQPVTAKQVQWTFRKVTLRHHFYQAYLVLSDEDRKSLYDALGEDALGFIHSGSWGPLIHLIGAKGSILFYLGATLLTIVTLFCFFFFLGCRADGYIAWSWTQVGSPLFVLVIAMLVITLVAAFVSIFWKPPWEEGMHWVERIPAVSNFTAALCYAIFTFVILSTLDKGNPERNFTTYFSLPIVADVVYYFGSLVWRWPLSVRLQMEYGLNRPSRCLCYGFFLLGLVYSALSIVQWFLIGQKIDQKIDISWYVAFVPLALRSGLRMLEAFMRSMVKRTIGIKKLVHVAFDTIGAFFFNGLWLASLYFSAIHITRGVESVRLMFALIPVYAVLLYLLCAMIFTAAYLFRQNTRSEREERLNNLKWTPTEVQTDEQSGPMLFRNFEADDEAADWGAIDDDDDDGSYVPFPKKEEPHSDYYDDIDSSGEEDIFKPAAGVPRANTPYGAFSPPDMGVRPYDASRTPTTSDTASTERPSRRPTHHDPYNLRVDAAPVTRLINHDDDDDDYDDDDYDYEEDGEEVGYYDDGDDRLATELSSSASSSAVFTASVVSPR